jgi:hypothetical protein
LTQIRGMIQSVLGGTQDGTIVPWHAVNAQRGVAAGLPP